MKNIYKKHVALKLEENTTTSTEDVDRDSFQDAVQILKQDREKDNTANYFHEEHENSRFIQYKWSLEYIHDSGLGFGHVTLSCVEYKDGSHD